MPQLVPQFQGGVQERYRGARGSGSARLWRGWNSRQWSAGPASGGPAGLPPLATMRLALLTRPLELAQLAPQVFDLLLVRGILALGQFQVFQHLFHFVERLAEGDNHLVHRLDRILHAFG